MEFTSAVGISIPRKESKDKVTGAAKYNSDIIYPGMLHGKVLTSTYAHAKIKSIDTSEALKAKGVKAVLTGDFYPVRVGTLIEDRPPIAKEKVRYFGEPVAVVVANSEQEAKNALKLVKVEYEPLKVINSVSEAFKDNSTLIHENLGEYKLTNKEVKPQPYTNIVDYIHIRKGDMLKGWKESEVIIEGVYSMPQSDHVAMETRNAIAQILPSGQVIINTSSQSPFHVKKAISKYFEIPEGDVTVVVPLVGGGFGGKSPVQLEMLAYIASRAVDGRPVRISNSREDDIEMSPSKVGLEAKVKIGAAKDGTIKALECTYLIDCGAYADICPRITTSTAMNCSGPYNIENVFCDAYCVYTNHNYGTAYRSFGHVSYAFCLERTLDKLADALKVNPYELRIKNAILPGNTSPTQVAMTSSNMGDITSCLKKLNEIMDCKEIVRAGEDGRMIRAKGISCFWKTSNSPSNAVSGAILTINHDGSINLNCGAVEIGPGMKTTLAQIIAERMKMDIKRIHVFMEVDTRVCPEHWKTVASMTTFMAGRAVLKAAEDLITQLKNHATIILRCPPEDLEVSNERVYLKDNPLYYVEFKDLARGYKYPDGVTVGGQIIARGDYCVRHISKLDKETGKGKPGPSWTVGAQAVVIEYDPEEYTYRILKAITVIDAGKIINPNSAKGLIMGGMSMGLGLGSREEFIYDNNAVLKNSSLRTYKVMHFGENPEYIVDFIETPQADAPFGARGLGEHGLIGMPSALANALSAAAEAEFDRVPITAEEIWRTKTGGKL